MEPELPKSSAETRLGEDRDTEPEKGSRLAFHTHTTHVAPQTRDTCTHLCLENAKPSHLHGARSNSPAQGQGAAVPVCRHHTHMGVPAVVPENEEQLVKAHKLKFLEVYRQYFIGYFSKTLLSISTEHLCSLLWLDICLSFQVSPLGNVIQW